MKLTRRSMVQTALVGSAVGIPAAQLLVESAPAQTPLSTNPVEVARGDYRIAGEVLTLFKLPRQIEPVARFEA